MARASRAIFASHFAAFCVFGSRDENNETSSMLSGPSPGVPRPLGGPEHAGDQARMVLGKEIRFMDLIDQHLFNFGVKQI